MKQLFWLSMWVVATLSLSQAIEAAKTWRSGLGAGFGPGLAFVVETACWLAGLAGAVGLLMLRSYAQERRRGRVQRPVALFERILERGADGE